MPRYDDTVAMMKPNTMVLSVAGIRSENSIETERLPEIGLEATCR